MTTTSRTVVIGSASGLHARPAKIFTTAAKETGLKVTLRKGDSRDVNAGAILSVMALAVRQGDEVTLTVEGDGAETAAEALAGLLARDLDAS